jgi:transposase-like protein
MAFRRIPHKDKVAAVNECIEIKNIKEIAKKYNISPKTLEDYCNCVLEETDEILQKKSLVGRVKLKILKFFRRKK